MKEVNFLHLTMLTYAFFLHKMVEVRLPVILFPRKSVDIDTWLLIYFTIFISILFDFTVNIKIATCDRSVVFSVHFGFLNQ